MLVVIEVVAVALLAFTVRHGEISGAANQRGIVGVVAVVAGA